MWIDLLLFSTSERLGTSVRTRAIYKAGQHKSCASQWKLGIEETRNATSISSLYQRRLFIAPNKSLIAKRMLVPFISFIMFITFRCDQHLSHAIGIYYVARSIERKIYTISQ